MNLSTPIQANEGGAVWGFYGGYELIPFFAIEAAYTHYPLAHLRFDPKSLFTYDHHNKTKLTTHTETVSLLGKFMVLIPETCVRAFSSVGLGGLHRKDSVTNRWCPSAVFEVGFNYNFTPYIMSEIGFNYTSGSGKSELNPAESFMPFLYSGYVRLAYRF